MTGLPGGFSRVSTDMRLVTKHPALGNPFLSNIFKSRSLVVLTRCHALLFFRVNFSRLVPPYLLIFPLGSFDNGFLDLRSECHALMLTTRAGADWCLVAAIDDNFGAFLISLMIGPWDFCLIKYFFLVTLKTLCALVDRVSGSLLCGTGAWCCGT